MSDSLKTINSIQEDWIRLINEYLTKDEREILTSRDSIELMDTILKWFTESNIVIPSRFSTITNFEYRLNSLITNVKDFWEKNSKSILEALGKLEPYALEQPLYMLQSSGSSVIRRLGIYFDTVYISDPLHLNNEDFDSLINKNEKSLERKVRLVQNLALVLQLNPLRSTNVDFPLFVVVPDLSIGNPERDILNSSGFILEKIIKDKTKYSSTKEVLYAIHQGEIDLTEKNVNKTDFDNLLSIFGYNKSGTSYMYKQGKRGYEVVPFTTHSSDSSTLLWLFSKLFDSFDAYSRSMLNAMSFGIDPIVPIEYWQIYEWLCKNIAPKGTLFSPSRIEEVVVSQGLLKKELKFLEAINIEDLRIIREEGKFNELRTNLRYDRVELKKATPESIDLIASKFASNLIDKVRLFGDEVKELEKKSKKKKIIQYSSLTGSAGVALLPFVFPTVALVSVLSSAVGVLFGGRSILDIYSSHKEEIKKKEYQVCSPLGILFSAYQKEK